MRSGRWRSDARSGAGTRLGRAVVAAVGATCCLLCFASPAVASEAAPSIATAFSPVAIAPNATTSLTFTITNPAANVDPLTGVAFTDTLPTGLTVVSATVTVCGGTLTTTSPTGIALSGATVAAGSECQFSVTVTGAATGPHTNTTGTVTSTNGGTGNTASANVFVGAPAIQGSFGASSIALGDTASLTFTIQNLNSSLALSGVGFTDALPSGLLVATPSGVSGSCQGGTITAVAGSASLSLSGAALQPGESCTFSVNVSGVSAGHQVNTTGPVTSAESGPAAAAAAALEVVGPPLLTEAFGAASIPLGSGTSLQFTITNPAANETSLTGIAFSDMLPSGLTISAPNGLTGSCGGGKITATGGSSTVSLSGASIPASASCTFSVNVVSTTAGVKTNTTDSVTSTNGGTGNAASATLTALAPPSASITAPADGASYKRGQAVVARYTCADDSTGPGIRTCSGPVASGSLLETGTAGAHSFTVTATSKDGLRSSKAVHYTVTAPPHSRIVRLGGSIAANSLKLFQGTSIGGSSPVARVAIALERISGGAVVAVAKRNPQCWALSASGSMVSTKPIGRRCPPLRFLKARGTTNWTFRLTRPLPPGKYVLSTRATDTAGRAESVFSADAGNRVTFTVR